LLKFFISYLYFFSKALLTFKIKFTMKIKATLLVFFICFLAQAQATEEKRDLIYQTNYECTLVGNNSAIALSKYNSPTIQETKLVLKTQALECQRTLGIVLTLASGEEITFKNAVVDCTLLDGGGYAVTGEIVLTELFYKKLSQAEIIAFTLGTLQVPVVFRDAGEDLKGLFKISEME
jgi:hypothetical protein